MGHVSASTTILLAAVLTACGSSQEPPRANSHVDANVPAPESFHSMLERDLLKYFSTLSSIRVTGVDATLLRDGPTQSGVAYPKYYAWVVLRSDTSQTRSGAVRIAAIDNPRFEVTDFLSKETLQADPAAAAKVFTAALVPNINKRALE